MTSIKTIVCATDFSECSRAALEFAIALAKPLDAHIRLVHVFEPPQVLGVQIEAATVSAQVFDILHTAAEERLLKELEFCHGAGIDVQAEHHTGAAFQSLVKLSEKADLIVMGTHGRTGLPHLMLGSVAERVVRLAKCPVVTVRHAKMDA